MPWLGLGSVGFGHALLSWMEEPSGVEHPWWWRDVPGSPALQPLAGNGCGCLNNVMAVDLVLGTEGSIVGSTAGARLEAAPFVGVINSLLIICHVNHQRPGVNHVYEMNLALALMSAES